MPHPPLIQVALHIPFLPIVDYFLPDTIPLSIIQPGQRLEVPFKKGIKIGIIVSTMQKTTLCTTKIKPAIRLIDKTPLLDTSLLKLAHWMSHYYHANLGEIFHTMLPTSIKEGLQLDIRDDNTALQIHETITALNAEQEIAIREIEANLTTYKTWVLDGVTGSGKTEVYLQIIARILKQGKQTLILIPEIGLTPQTIARFESRFTTDIVMLHSGLTDSERAKVWLKAKQGIAKIIIGTRSAVFVPLPDLGLIIVDEAHDSSFKQQEKLRYHARDVAVKRAQLSGIPIILGSATHTLETLYNTELQRFHLLRLQARAGLAMPPTFKIIDIRKQCLQEGLAPSLFDKIKEKLQANEQVLIYLNRRGFAPVLMCHHCGWLAECPHCDAKMTYHLAPYHLRCHHCNTVKKILEVCPTCQSTALIPIGLGTVKVEKILKTIFKDANILRIDKDNTRRKGAMQHFLDEIQTGKANILIGTQMLAKGHHFPNVTLVIILDGDAGFFSADFRAAEQFAQILIQVSGRAGRETKPGEVIIQTRHPTHVGLNHLIQFGYADFAKLILAERKLAGLPPFSALMLIRAKHRELHPLDEFLSQIKTLATRRSQSDTPIQILGPIPSPMQKRAKYYHSQLLLQSSDKSTLNHFVTTIIPEIHKLPLAKKIRWSMDVDPIDLS